MRIADTQKFDVQLFRGVISGKLNQFYCLSHGQVPYISLRTSSTPPPFAVADVRGKGKGKAKDEGSEIIQQHGPWLIYGLYMVDTWVVYG